MPMKRSLFCLLFKYSSLRCDPPYHPPEDPVLNVSPIPQATEETAEPEVRCHTRGSTHSPPTVLGAGQRTKGC